MNFEAGRRRCYLCLQRYILVFIFVSFCLGILMGIFLVTKSDSLKSYSDADKQLQDKVFKHKVAKVRSGDVMELLADDIMSQVTSNELHLTKTSKKKAKPKNNTRLFKVNYKVHVFYYAWYRNPVFDKAYSHWNHKYIPHWLRNEIHRYPSGNHNPPEDIASNFYPALGCYSSGNPVIVDAHMRQINSAKIGVVVLSWYPPNKADENGFPVDHLVPLIMDVAHKYKIKVAFHIEPFADRNQETLRSSLRYIIDNYGSHPAFYRHIVGKKKLPMFYIYDSYLITSKQWGDLLHPDGKLTVRGSDLDAFFIGLLVQQSHKAEIRRSAFDGFYTYFAVNGFSYGSSWKNWKSLNTFARDNKLLFIPSVGPGYVDESVRPWNVQNTRSRRNGTYYEMAFRSAISSGAKFVSVTSFNEWHEGTQIEPAIPKNTGHNNYFSYSPQQPDFYLTLTRKWVAQVR